MGFSILNGYLEIKVEIVDKIRMNSNGNFDYQATIGKCISSSKNGMIAHEAIVISAGTKNAIPNTKVNIIDSLITLH